MVANNLLDLFLLPFPHFLDKSHDHLLMAHGDHNGDIICTVDLLTLSTCIFLCYIWEHVCLSKS